MHWKAVRRSLRHVTEKEIFWLVGYAVLTGSIVAKSTASLFYAERVTSAAVLELWTLTFANDTIFSIWLVFGIAKNAFRPMMAKLMVALIMVGLLCNWIMAYAVTYRYLGIIDSEKEVSDSITCLYFSIVTWTTLGYGDVRPSLDARLIAASEALLGYIWMAAFIGLLAELLRQLAREITRRSRPVRRTSTPQRSLYPPIGD